MKTIEVEEIVENYKTKNKLGFTETELEDLLAKFPTISKVDFNKYLGVITVMIDENGDVITYKRDVEKAIINGLNNVKP